MYHATRSKKLVFFFVRSQSKCKLSKSYRDQKKYYASVLKRRAENDNVFIPLNISVDRSITFAIDNIDLKIDAPDGKQLHGTATVVYQQKSEDEHA